MASKGERRSQDRGSIGRLRKVAVMHGVWAAHRLTRAGPPAARGGRPAAEQREQPQRSQRGAPPHSTLQAPQSPICQV